jgi:hypothetical protein
LTRLNSALGFSASLAGEAGIIHTRLVPNFIGGSAEQFALHKLFDPTSPLWASGGLHRPPQLCGLGVLFDIPIGK